MTKARARVLMPNCGQMEFWASDLEALLPEGHRARLVWAWVERQALRRLYEAIQVEEGGVGARRSPLRSCWPCSCTPCGTGWAARARCAV